MSQPAALPTEPFEPANGTTGAPAWKQEVNQRVAAHRNRRGMAQPEAAPKPAARPANSRAAQAAARVAARYAAAPSYGESSYGDTSYGETGYDDGMSGEGTAASRVAEAVAKAAVEAVMAEMGSAAMTPTLWDVPVGMSQQPREAVAESNAQRVAVAGPQAAPSRWQDEKPVVTAATIAPRWEDTVPPVPKVDLPAVFQDNVWESMRVEPVASGQAHAERRARRSGMPAEAQVGLDLFAEEMVEPAQPLPANLIQFPRELVATRKARPRQVEHPYERARGNAQLSIFEVDPEMLEMAVERAEAAAVVEQVAPPEWASIELEHQPVARWSDAPVAESVYASVMFEPTVAVEPEAEEQSASAFQAEPVAAGPMITGQTAASASWEEYTLRESWPALGQSSASRTMWVPGSSVAERQGLSAQNAIAPSLVTSSPIASSSSVELLVASMGERAMAALVDLCVVLMGLCAAAFVAVAVMPEMPSGRVAAIGAGAGFVLLGMLYQWLFLRYAEAGTLGMKYARIALCTFADDNPTPAQMVLRIPAQLVSLLPAGLGLLWAAVDKEHVSWHDRLTGTYQRKY